MSEPKDEYDAFFEELTALTLKHGIAIGGCGCCGSPFTVSIGEPDEKPGYDFSMMSEFEWDNYHRRYFCDLGELQEANKNAKQTKMRSRLTRSRS